MAQIVSLRRSEPASFDYGVLLRLEASLGPVRSREVLADACCAIIEKLTRFETAEEAEDAHRLARSIAALSEEIGMYALAHAARAASDCALSPDPAARSATAGRLLRVAEASLDTLLTNGGAG